MFCLNYYPAQKYIQDADEFKIKYRPADRTLEEFLKTYQNKSIVIDVTDNFEDIDAQLFKGLSEKYKNFKLIINFYNKDHLQRVQENEIPFFFSNFVTTVDELHGLMQYHPTDMYICEELGFSLDKVSSLLHFNNIKVRVFPNICQSSFSDTPSIKTFFIRPEDVIIYSNYVDVFELISDQDSQRTLFKIYQQQKWAGKLSEIIPTFKDNLDERYLMDSFGVIRTQCGKRCMYKPGSCNICDRFIDLADSFKENGIIIRKIKKIN